MDDGERGTIRSEIGGFDVFDFGLRCAVSAVVREVAGMHEAREFHRTEGDGIFAARGNCQETGILNSDRIATDAISGNRIELFVTAFPGGRVNDITTIGGEASAFGVAAAIGELVKRGAGR